MDSAGSLIHMNLDMMGKVTPHSSRYRGQINLP